MPKRLSGSSWFFGMEGNGMKQWPGLQYVRKGSDSSENNVFLRNLPPKFRIVIFSFSSFSSFFLHALYQQCDCPSCWWHEERDFVYITWPSFQNGIDAFFTNVFSMLLLIYYSISILYTVKRLEAHTSPRNLASPFTEVLLGQRMGLYYWDRTKARTESKVGYY